MSAPEAPSAWRITKVIALAQATLETLRTSQGLVIETDAAALEALAAEGVAIDALLLGMVRAQAEAKAGADMLAGRIAELNVRLARFERQRDRWRETIVAALQALELTSWSSPEATLSIAPGKGKIYVPDVEALPPRYVEAVTTKRPLTADLRAALAQGEDIPGVSVGNAHPVLTVRIR